MNLPPEAAKGKSVKEAWAGLVKWAKSIRLRAGPGVRLTHTASGTTISFTARRQVFRGAFAVTLAGNSATVGMGTVDGIEPTISGVKIGGEKEKPAPALRLRLDRYDEEGRTWVCVAVKTDKAGKLDPKDKAAAIIVQADHPTKKTKDGRTIAPLAMLRRDDPENTKDFGTLYQIAYFNLNLWRDANGRLLFAP